MLYTLSQIVLLLQAAEEAAPTEGGTKDSPGGLFSGGFLVPLIGVIVIFYFVLIRPEKKKQKERQALLNEMKKGDKVMTTSGIYGTIAQIQDEVVTVQVADGVRIRFAKGAVQNLLETGDKKDA